MLAYTYDLNNRLLKEDKVNILTATTTNYVYDENGNQLSKMSYTLTNTTGGGTELGIVVIGDGFNGEESNHVADLSNYDVFNRLIKTQNDKGIILYTYKPDGLRLSKKVNNLLTTHIWDGSNIVLDLESGNSVIGKYTRGIDLVKNQKGQYFVFNAHGDVVQLTDASGNVVKNYHYDAFGVEENINKDDNNPFRYCAEYYDKETGTIYLSARYYNPSIGRFISQDPIRDGLNWYTYCGNSPVMWVDPSGLKFVQLKEKLDTLKTNADGAKLYHSLVWNANEKSATARIYTNIISVDYPSYYDAKFTFDVGVDGTYIGKDDRIYVDENLFYDIFSPVIIGPSGLGIVHSPSLTDVVKFAATFATFYTFRKEMFASSESSKLGIVAPGFASKGGESKINVTEQMIRTAMKGSTLQSQQSGVSLPVIQRYVDRLVNGETAPPIKVDNGILVDGYHRYIAGKIFGQEPAQIQWSGGNPNKVIEWSKMIIDSVDWGNQ